jgi:hypothetical protein
MTADRFAALDRLAGALGDHWGYEAILDASYDVAMDAVLAVLPAIANELERQANGCEPTNALCAESPALAAVKAVKAEGWRDVAGYLRSLVAVPANEDSAKHPCICGHPRDIHWNPAGGKCRTLAGCDCLIFQRDVSVPESLHPSICAARNDEAASRCGYDEYCTMPNGHSIWTVNPTTGYSYNHCNVAMDSWWNDGSPPLGMSREDWLEGS